MFEWGVLKVYSSPLAWEVSQSRCRFPQLSVCSSRTPSFSSLPLSGRWPCAFSTDRTVKGWWIIKHETDRLLDFFSGDSEQHSPFYRGAIIFAPRSQKRAFSNDRALVIEGTSSNGSKSCKKLNTALKDVQRCDVDNFPITAFHCIYQIYTSCFNVVEHPQHFSARVFDATCFRFRGDKERFE